MCWKGIKEKAPVTVPVGQIFGLQRDFGLQGDTLCGCLPKGSSSPYLYKFQRKPQKTPNS